jgi:hypothetical protein
MFDAEEENVLRDFLLLLVVTVEDILGAFDKVITEFIYPIILKDLGSKPKLIVHQMLVHGFRSKAQT